MTVPVTEQNPPPVEERGGRLLPLSTTVVKKGVNEATEIGCPDTVDGQTELRQLAFNDPVDPGLAFRNHFMLPLSMTNSMAVIHRANELYNKHLGRTVLTMSLEN